MLLDLPSDDLLILESHQLARFRAFFGDSLPFCWIFLDQKNELKIHCPEPWLVDLLLCEVEYLCGYAWLILGALQLSIYYAEEEIYSVSTLALIQRSQLPLDLPTAS